MIVMKIKIFEKGDNMSQNGMIISHYFIKTINMSNAISYLKYNTNI